jgi:2-dehydro-3-deoxy-D-gluconate 5-dehydrogenase
MTNKEDGARKEGATLDRFRLDGKVAIVTGGTAGIGRAMAIGLAAAGAGVVVLGRSHDPEETCKAIRALGRDALGFRGDICESEFTERAVRETVAHWGHVDILVNSAGVQARAPSLNYPEADWDRVIGLNLTALFRLCQRVGRHMIEQKSGKIINIASIVSFIGGITIPAYAASKGGVAQVTKALANEWAKFNINVNAIAPGYILTDMTETLHDDPGRSAEILSRTPAGRWGTPEDLSGAVVFLASAASNFVHGHVLTVDGGWMGR